MSILVVAVPWHAQMKNEKFGCANAGCRIQNNRFLCESCYLDCMYLPNADVKYMQGSSRMFSHEARYDYIRSTLPFAEIKMWVSLLGSHGSNYSASIIQRQEYCKSRKTQQAEDILLAGARTNDRMR